jgi:hypothetical protein
MNIICASPAMRVSSYLWFMQCMASGVTYAQSLQRGNFFRTKVCPRRLSFLQLKYNGQVELIPMLLLFHVDVYFVFHADSLMQIAGDLACRAAVGATVAKKALNIRHVNCQPQSINSAYSQNTCF